MPLLYLCCFILASLLRGPTATANDQRQADVAARGPDVMPFRLSATTHVFTKTATGGTQRVIARDPTDATQTALVRQHLHEIKAQFESGNFSGPSHIHGNDMPWLATLKSATPGDIRIAYRDVDGVSELTYRADKPRLVDALHTWFDAQLSDHGADAMQGHDHEHMQHDAPHN